jgi:hypothetical protein
MQTRMAETPYERTLGWFAMPDIALNTRKIRMLLFMAFRIYSVRPSAKNQ